MQIDELNQLFAIAGIAELVAGNGGLAKVRITAPAASGEIYLHGAEVVSWRPGGAEEVIFVSERSHWEDGRAIRGGIPVCFPWFRGKADDPKAPAHGVVRSRAWALQSITAGGDGSVTVVCVTGSDEATRGWWPHDFRLIHHINIGRTLRMELTATNTGSTEFRFEEALHTYFRVGDVERVEVRGLNGTTYLDNMDGNREKLQTGELTLSGPIDNAYLNATGPAAIFDPVLGRTFVTEKETSSTTVVWNPWRDGAAKLTDLGDEEWHAMVCVEGANILGAAISLAPGQSHTMRVTLTPLDALRSRP
jgi:glucose-6-phosphate 1-epimerase